MNSSQRHPLYSVWSSMKDRCGNPNNPQYADYGGRGIHVCEEWSGPDGHLRFIPWALAHGWEPGLTTERRDNNDGGAYSPENCYYATRTQQQRNRRNNRLVTAWGETKVAIAWLEDERAHPGLSKRTFFNRLARLKSDGAGYWTAEEAISRPPLHESYERK